MNSDIDLTEVIKTLEEFKNQLKELKESQEDFFETVLHIIISALDEDGKET